MQHDNSLITEMHTRLEHLRSMPAIPFRTREILGLERALSLAAKQGVQRTREGKVVTRRKRSSAGPSKDEDKAVRRVEHINGRRRIIVRSPQIDSKVSAGSAEKEMRSRKAKMDEIKSMVGLTHRGMS